MSDHDTTDADSAKALLRSEVTPSTLLATLEHSLRPCTLKGEPKKQANVMVWGAMGIGKTDVCRSLGALWGLRVVALHLPQYDPTDLKGIPVLLDKSGNTLGEIDTDGKVKWIPSSYLPKFIRHSVAEDGNYVQGINWSSAESLMVHVNDSAGKNISRTNDQMQGDLAAKGITVTIEGTKKVTVSGVKQGMEVLIIDKALLFLDELSAAVPEVQNAALQLVLDKRVGEYDVPPFTPLVAAGNRESDQAFVSPMSMPLANRFMHLRLTHSLGDWVEWAMVNRIDAGILGFLQWKKNALFNFNPDAATEGDYGFPTPRSWAMLSDQMRDIDELPDVCSNAIINGLLGTAMGNTFIEHRKVADKLPSVDDILQGKNVDIDQRLNVGAKYHLATALCYGLADYHAKYYDESIGGGVEEQPKEWGTAATAFCDFIDKYLGKEMTVLCVHIASRHLEISFVKFRGTEFTGFAKKYRDVLRRTV
jgi:MoxR-like ATPase